ncbi:MAG: MarR family transcriptional regulator [Pseudomonadota bacterium]
MTQDLIDRLLTDWEQQGLAVDPQAMAVVGRAIHLGRLLESRVNALLRPHKLTYSEFDILATLRRTGGDYCLSPTRLRDSVLLTSGAMTSAVDRLVAKSLVTRERTGADRRSVSVRLSETGKVLIDELIALRFEDATATLSVLSPAQAATTATSLKRLIMHTQALAAEQPRQVEALR